MQAFGEGKDRMDYGPKHLVESGYNHIAQRYLEWSRPSPARMGYLQNLLERLVTSAHVLELGCGAGVPCTQLLAKKAHVTGIDISAVQIELAKQYVPSATLFQADMMILEFPPATFDAIVGFYSLIHLPRTEQSILIPCIAEWLCPGGWFLANLGISNDPGSIEHDWLGTTMYWSSYDVQKNLEMVSQAGLTLVKAEVLIDDEDGGPASFLWILAKKDASASSV